MTPTTGGERERGMRPDVEQVERVTLVRRGKRVGATGEAAEYEWWQELPPQHAADSLRSVGYPVRTFVPAAALDGALDALDDLVEAAERFTNAAAYTVEESEEYDLAAALDEARSTLTTNERNPS